jgi:hypothetical protein
MAIRDKLRTNTAAYLQEDEVVEAIFPAQTHSQYLFLISLWLLLILNSYRIVVVTNRRIVVLRGGKMRLTTVKDQLREVPRSTQIGPAKGLWYRFDSLGERLYVNTRFHKDIEAADNSLPPLSV